MKKVRKEALSRLRHDVWWNDTFYIGSVRNGDDTDYCVYTKSETGDRCIWLFCYSLDDAIEVSSYIRSLQAEQKRQLETTGWT